jgi:phosphatidate cytidylyltransferase
MHNKFKNLAKRTITGIILGALFWISFIYLPPWCFSLVIIAILAQIIAFEWTRLFDPKTALFWFIMPFYPILPFLLILWMNHSCYRPLLFILFILVSAHDTGSYLIGNLFGKHHIASMISPGKTWEGFFGGYLFACGGLLLALWELGDIKPLWFIMLFSLMVCLTSLFGDLFESWLKRRARVKDSGIILPGHGGFLDRFDGIMFTVFFFYLFRDWLLAYFPSITC